MNNSADGTSTNINHHTADRSASVDRNTAPDRMLNKSIVINQQKCIIKGYITCNEQRLFAIESEEQMPSYNGRCPFCHRQHVVLAEQRGYYATVDSIFDRLEKEELMQQRTQRTLKVDQLPHIIECVPPLTQSLIGRDKGIQGDWNSCYMDASIFCMFAYESVFDSILNKKVDNQSALAVQQILRDNVVYVLRRTPGLVRRM
jgi:hypothetical protein